MEFDAGWRVSAEQRLDDSSVGQQVEVGTFPMSSTLSRNGKYLLTLNAGYDPPTISVIEVASKKIWADTWKMRG